MVRFCDSKTSAGLNLPLELFTRLTLAYSLAQAFMKQAARILVLFD